jgi:hypothetical protein
MKNLLFILLAILLTTASCKKWQHEFPEDGERTKKTPKERICDKWWVLSQVTLNGQDYTDSVYQQFGKYKVFFTSNLSHTTNNDVDVFLAT